MPPTGHRQNRPIGTQRHQVSARNKGLLLIVGLAVAAALVVVSVTTLAGSSPFQAKPQEVRPQPSVASVVHVQAAPEPTPPAQAAEEASAPKSREEWLAELEARTIREPKSRDATASAPAITKPGAPPAKSEEEAQLELANSIYRPILEPVAPNIRQLGEIRWRYERVCTGVTVVQGETEGTWAEGNQTVIGRRRNGSIGVIGTLTTQVWVPSRTTTSTIQKSEAPECQAMALEANQHAAAIREARELAERAAIEKGVWTRIRSQVEEQVLDSLTR